MTNRTSTHLHRAARALDGKHPIHDFPIREGSAEAIPYALLALASEQQRTSDALERIATALENQNQPEPNTTSPRKNATPHLDGLHALLAFGIALLAVVLGSGVYALFA